ncbi:hypothetical protein K435DRAFT_717149 [Dendrothele bispora CBS 962.96]|uniref:Metallo-beta-lactamase domain-containing protein n=1 Tax=Dendrothele bispora (strain CBS 962.96) TaxID=1314807 RepID=A0A4S8MI19_DENBC|nr:hypothetical protein K435DRAFT_717149 [Dendrothele bispora CBS 962.96]
MSDQLKSVDQLTITFLVDNCIEWFTQLPPGFTHELPQHLRFHHPEIDKITNTPILDFDKFCCGAHGFSALIQTQISDTTPELVLFDTGPDSLSLVRNISAMQIPVEKITRVITSHWHSDHTGGLLSFLRLRNSATTSETGPVTSCIIDVHPDQPIARGIAPGPTYDTVICRLAPDPSFELIQETGGTLELHDEGHVVAGGTVYVSGEIPRVTEWETGLPGAMRWKDGTGWTPETHIMDERYAAIDVLGKGLVLFSACSHAGIVNVVKDAVSRFSRPVYMIIGGLHLAGKDFSPRIAPTVKFLSEQLRPSPTYVLPMHCSGFASKVALEQAFGEGCVPAGVGLKVEVVGDKEHDKRLSPAVY